MKKTEKLIKALKVLMINLLIGSLLQNPFIDSAMAASNNGFEAKDILSLANGALGIYSNYLGQKQQMMQAQISAAANQKLMAQLSPSCRKADGTACYVTQSKFFPECNLPATISNMPMNACPSMTPDPAQISSMLTYESIAQGWMNYYDQMSNEASNASYPIGLKCLEDKQKALDSQLTEMMNSLQRLQDRLNQDKQTFRDNNKKLLSDMDAAKEELFGGSTNLKAKTQDFSKYFSQSCQSVIGKDNLKNGTTNGGLNGVLQGLTSVNKSASDFNLNKSSLEADIRAETAKIASTISANGLYSYLNSGYSKGQNSAFNVKDGVIDTISGQQAREFNTAYTRIQKTLDEVGYKTDLTKLDGNFSVDTTSFMAGANDYFKKKYVNDCVTGADKGIAIPVDQILKSIKQSGNSGFVTGSAVGAYRSALQTILNSSAMMSDKMDQIKALEANYPGMIITYNDSSSNVVSDSPYNLFMKTIDKCEQRYTQDDTFSSKGSGGVSYQEKVNRAKAALQELKNLNDSYASKLSSSILSQVLECGGASLKAGSCSEGTLDASSKGFCLTQASTCASQIQGCYAEANTQVQARKTKMENLAKTFNANVAAMIARSNALYDQQKAAVTNIVQTIQARFPGTNFEIPKDMFVAMPEMKKDTYGVDMVADGNLSSFLEGSASMPEKIEKLKQMFKLQKGTVDDSLKEYIGQQKQAMADQKERWANLNKDCKDKVDSSSRAIAKLNEEGQKNQAKQDADVAKFCKKYNSISQNPVGACNKAKDLADLSDQISARLTNQALSITEQYASACDGYMNQSDALSSLPAKCLDGTATGKEKLNCDKLVGKIADTDGSKGKSGKSGKKAKKITLSSLCGSDGGKSDSDFISNVSDKLTSDDKDKLSKVKNLSDISDVSDDLSDASSTFFDNVSELAGGSSATDVCKKLNQIQADGSKASDADSAVKTAQAAADAAQKAYDAAEKDATKQAALKPDLDAKKEALKTAQASKESAAGNKKKLDALNEALVTLASAKSGGVSTPEDPQVAALTKLGEQSIGQCDTQSNATVAKGNSGFDLNSWDNQFMNSLGKSK